MFFLEKVGARPHCTYWQGVTEVIKTNTGRCEVSLPFRRVQIMGCKFLDRNATPFGLVSDATEPTAWSVWSCWNGNDPNDPNENDNYNPDAGISMAAPHVAGACALVRARYSGESYQQIITRVLTAVDPVPSLAGKTKTGGRLNLLRALARHWPRMETRTGILRPHSTGQLGFPVAEPRPDRFRSITDPTVQPATRTMIREPFAPAIAELFRQCCQAGTISRTASATAPT